MKTINGVAIATEFLLNTIMTLVYLFEFYPEL